MASSSNPVTLITGASSGIGLSTSRLLAQQGIDVVMVARNEERLRKAAGGIDAAEGVRVETIAADMGNPARAEATVRGVIERMGRLDVLINNAGMGEVRAIPESDDQFIETTFAVNVLGPMAAIRGAWKHWLERGGGCVVNISSWAARDPFPGFFAYGASKAALNGVTRSCHNDGHEAGVRAFSVCPGAVETPMLRASFDEKTVGKELCLSPEDVAKVVLACVRGERDSEVGRAIYVRRGEDGGVEITIGD
ncbi:MAG: SDR family oxidoreductase [Phycisphaeraceae bacterium]|nr:MAG: SDR family oxidoreductase [Phycisphaeraceae bacterium]